MPLSRRDLLCRAALGAAGLTLGRFALPTSLTPAARAAELFATPLPIPEVLTDPDITLRAAVADVQILPGAPTKMWTFNGTFPGPTIRRPAGTTTRVTVEHALPAEADTLTIHHHGAHTASIHDGLPEREVIAPGASRTYVYDHVEGGEAERAAMQWYHDHSHHRTSFNSWMGLSGFFILDDEVEAALPLPRGDYELPLHITDRLFDDNNQLNNVLFNKPPASPALGSSALREIAGNTYLVNGAPTPFAEVEPRRYRLRVHNASGFRLLNLVLLDGTTRIPMTQIGTESGLLPAPVERTAILLGPAERADIVVDLANFPGKSLVLDSVGRNPAPLADDSAKSGGLVQLRVGELVTEADPGLPPAQLRALPAWTAETSKQPDRLWVFGRGVDINTREQVHTINGRPFDHGRIDAKVGLDTVETWLLVNASPKSHYIHIHDVDWLVLERNGAAPAAYEAGLKETFRLDPGEFVTVAAKFTDHLGAYMIHCHMLDHEDGGMMTAWEVVEPGAAIPTTVTPNERQRVNALLAAARRTPGSPAPAGLVAQLADAVVVDSNDPFFCELG